MNRSTHTEAKTGQDRPLTARNMTVLIDLPCWALPERSKKPMCSPFQSVRRDTWKMPTILLFFNLGALPEKSIAFITITSEGDLSALFHIGFHYTNKWIICQQFQIIICCDYHSTKLSQSYDVCMKKMWTWNIMSLSLYGDCVELVIRSLRISNCLSAILIPRLKWFLTWSDFVTWANLAFKLSLLF